MGSQQQWPAAAACISVLQLLQLLRQVQLLRRQTLVVSTKI